MNKRGYEIVSLMTFYVLLGIIIISVLAWRINDVVDYSSGIINKKFIKLDTELTEDAIKASPDRIKFVEYLGEKSEKSSS